MSASAARNHERVSAPTNATFKLNGFTVGWTANKTVFSFDQNLPGTSVYIGDELKFKLGHRYLPNRGWAVYVNTAMPAGAKLNSGLEPTWNGIRNTEAIARFDNEYLLEVREGDSFLIYYPNGAVAKVSMKSNPVGLEVTQLDPTLTLAMRLLFVTEMFKAAESLAGDVRAVRMDRTFHELASMILLTKLYPELRKQICSIVGMAVKKYGKLRPGVKKHFQDVLFSLDDSNEYWWMKRESDPALDPLPSTQQRSGGTPADERARKAARAEQDRQIRLGMKGQARNDDSNNGRGNKKK